MDRLQWTGKRARVTCVKPSRRAHLPHLSAAVRQVSRWAGTPAAPVIEVWMWQVDGGVDILPAGERERGRRLGGDIQEGGQE